MSDAPQQPHPLRIQRKRSKGYKMPPDAVYVGRPTIWGNPFQSAGQFRRFLKMSDGKIMASVLNAAGDAEPIAGLHLIMQRNEIIRRLPELRGKRLACWCGLDCECHADILCEMANTIAAGEQCA